MADRTYRVVVRLFRGAFKALGLKFLVRGQSNIPREGAAVLACNHISYLDFALNGQVATGSQRLVRFMAKQSVFENALAGPLMRAMGHISVDRKNGSSAYRQATRKLDDGQIVGIFPEGTIGRAWTLKAFKPGAAALAINKQVPLIPLVGWGGHRVATVDGRRSVKRGKHVMIMVGAPLHPGPDADIDEVTAELHAVMKGMLDQVQAEFPDRPTGDDDRWWIPQHLGGTAPDPETAALIDIERATR